jgi:hypothetical protein
MSGCREAKLVGGCSVKNPSLEHATPHKTLPTISYTLTVKRLRAKSPYAMRVIDDRNVGLEYRFV